MKAWVKKCRKLCTKGIIVLSLATLCFAAGFINALPVKEVIQYRAEKAGNVIPLVYSANVRPFVAAWTHEIARRYRGAVAVFAHGSSVNGEWYCEYPSESGQIRVQKLVDDLRYIYPMRTIVLVICNFGHEILGRDIVYSLETIWLMPDRNLSVRSWPEPEFIGNIYEFTEN